MSNETQHTPGPWQVKGSRRPEFRHPQDPPNYIVGRVGFGIIAEVCGAVNVDRLKQPGTVAEANAKVVASAPELLEALEYARRIVADQLGENSGHLQPLDAAIAKARGQNE